MSERLFYFSRDTDRNMYNLFRILKIVKNSKSMKEDNLKRKVGSREKNLFLWGQELPAAQSSAQSHFFAWDSITPFNSDSTSARLSNDNKQLRFCAKDLEDLQKLKVEKLEVIKWTRAGELRGSVTKENFNSKDLNYLRNMRAMCQRSSLAQGKCIIKMKVFIQQIRKLSALKLRGSYRS